MFIVEGADGSGKTGVAERLAGLLGAKKLHEGGPPKTREEGIRRMEWQFDSFGQVLDRAFIISEMIYGPIIRGSLIVEEDVIEGWADRFIRKGWILIYCRPSDRTILEYARKGTMESVIASSKKIYKEDGHVELVKIRMEKILEAYDARIDDLRRRGMEVFYHVRDKSFVR